MLMLLKGHAIGQRNQTFHLNVSSKSLHLKLGVTTQASSPSAHEVETGGTEFEAAFSR